MKTSISTIRAITALHQCHQMHKIKANGNKNALLVTENLTFFAKTSVFWPIIKFFCEKYMHVPDAQM